jgi:hypothetical protein
MAVQNALREFALLPGGLGRRGARFRARPGVLELPLEGDAPLALWGLERRAGTEAFARVFGRPLDG